jgi:hypothetical protein
MNDNTKPEPWFALERRLRDDAQGGERDTLLRSLEDQASRVRRQLDAGVPPAEFARLKRVSEGIIAAIEVVNLVWRRYHPV